MDNIVFKISKNSLFISLYKKDKKEEDLNNTNIIDIKNLYFSTIYIKENLELVSSFLNVIVLKQNINKVIIKDYKIINLVLDLIKNISNIKELDITPDKILTYDAFMKILDNNYLNTINAFDIPKYLLERLDINKNISVNLRCEILFISNFMNDNKLSTYSDIYYKKNILINNKFKEIDINDYLAFIKINNHLRIIEFNYFDTELFNLIMDEIIAQNKSNIKIIFNEEFIDLNTLIDTVNKYKDKNKDYLSKNEIEFKINYSDEYIKDNTFKQINLNVIKIALIGIILTVLLMMGINIYNNHKDMEKSTKIENDILNIINKVNTNEEEINNNENNSIEYIEPNNDEMNFLKTTTTSIYDIKYQMMFNELKEINSDTVGWLKVNNTNIDYPVVQSADNDFYLKNDYYKNSNRHGWIFMDYRDDAINLSRNIIIYGHNLANQKMFGTLRYVLNKSWYAKTSNQIITFNTTEQNMNWQIFSIYKVPVTTDYLTTEFSNDNDYLEFIKMIKDRSIYDFNVELDANDKILTLSTCSNGNDQRLVVHAKLIKEN